MDKVIGFMILNQVLPEDKVPVISGRVSSDILIKTARSGISILVSRFQVPTDLCSQSCKSAWYYPYSICAWKRMNIYAWEERIDIAKKGRCNDIIIAYHFVLSMRFYEFYYCKS